MALLACLPACASTVTVRQPALTGDAAAIRAELARACPRASTPAETMAIKAELDSLDASGDLARVDHLATEWDRLNAGAVACRGT